MNVVWDPTQAALAAAGGGLIGLAASLLWLANGRVAGISGIVGGLLRPIDDIDWRASFVGGLVVTGLVLSLLVPERFGVPPIASLGLVALAGVLVGFGTRIGHGCTSGHGVCGLSRGSQRSLVATLTFMGVAVATTYLVRHVFGVAGGA